MKRRKASPVWIRWGLFALSMAVSMLVAECFVRVVARQDTFDHGQHLRNIRKGSEIEVDPAFGFRPRLSNHLRDRFGVKRDSDGRERDDDRTRLLFVGDSVTNRAKIIDALKEQLGTKDYVYFNAGVEGFNTAQITDFYLKYNRGIDPDDVIYTFHNNDFLSTPVAFAKQGGDLFVVIAGCLGLGMHPWLFTNSHLYRLLVGEVLAWASDPGAACHDAEGVERALVRLQSSLRQDGIRFTVLLFPIVRRPAVWTEEQNASRKESIQIFNALGVTWLDLRPALEQGIEMFDGAEDLREKPIDVWHPSEIMGNLIARYVIGAGVLSGSRDPEVLE